MNRYKMNVSLAFDDKYLKYAYITIMSLYINNPDAEIYTYILQYDLSEESINYLNELAKKYQNHIVLLTIDPDRFSNLPARKKWPMQIYFRLLLPEQLPEDVDRIIYLDSDMTVNSSLAELYNMDFNDNDIIACYDLNLMAATYDTFMDSRHEVLAKSFENKTYVNSGMLVMNISRIRETCSLETYLNAAKELDYKIYAPDQDLINYVHADKILHADPRKYNYPAYVAFLEGLRSDTAEKAPITHFVCEKPWQGGNHAHFETELIWWKYAYQSPFKDFFIDNYIKESMADPTIMKCLSGTDEVKNSLVRQNVQLKKELTSAMDQVKKVIALLSNKDT